MRSKKEAPVSSDLKSSQGELRRGGPAVDGGIFLPLPDKCKTVIPLVEDQILFSQGESGDRVFYIRKGRIKLTIASKAGREATIALLGPGDFVGQECVAAGHALRLATASAIADSEILRIEKNDMIRALHEDRTFSDFFSAFLLERSIRIQADLVRSTLQFQRKTPSQAAAAACPI